MDTMIAARLHAYGAPMTVRTSINSIFLPDARKSDSCLGVMVLINVLLLNKKM